MFYYRISYATTTTITLTRQKDAKCDCKFPEVFETEIPVGTYGQTMEIEIECANVTGKGAVKAIIGVGKISLRKAIPMFNRPSSFVVELTNTDKGIKKGRIAVKGYIEAPERDSEGEIEGTEEQSSTVFSATRGVASSRRSVSSSFDFANLPSFPTRLSVTSYNLWGNKHWPERSLVLGQIFHNLKSDVYMLQKVSPDIIGFLDKHLGEMYGRVELDEDGWETESNIYFDSHKFAMINHGLETFTPLGSGESARGVFWVRLEVVDNAATLRGASADAADATLYPPPPPSKKKTVVFCTARLSSDKELPAEQQPAQRVSLCTCIQNIMTKSRENTDFDDVFVFAGDFGCDAHRVIKYLRVATAGTADLTDIFEKMDMLHPKTFPVRPSDEESADAPDCASDRIMVSQQCRVNAAFVKGIRSGSMPPPSNHLPVIGLLEIL